MDKFKKDLLFLLLILALAFIQITKPFHFNKIQLKFNSNLSQIALPKGNQIKINLKDPYIYNVSINEPSELDFLTKEKVLESRKHYVSLYPDFINQNYAPSEFVFGRIVDGKPWWGQIGINCKGPGNDSIDGLSEETRFINNPMILLALDTNYALPIPNWDCTGFYPEPVQVSYQPGAKKITVTYKLSNFFLYIKNTRWEKVDPPLFYLNAENARDFGYEYAYAYNNVNIKYSTPDNLGNNIQEMRDYIHLGHSCEYPGGCNNSGTKDQTNMNFDTTHLPAKIQMKLWKQSPVNKDAAADFYFDLVFE